MAHVQAGDVDAFGELYDRYRDRAYRVSWSVCGNDGRAEEALQEAFVSIWGGRATYQPRRGTVAAWLLTVVRDQAIDVASRNHKQASQRPTDDRLDARSAHEDVGVLPADRADAGHLQWLLAQLPNAQQEVITLAFYGQLTHTEIAEQLGLPPGTVRSRMRLGLHKLRDELPGKTA